MDRVLPGGAQGTIHGAAAALLAAGISGTDTNIAKTMIGDAVLEICELAGDRQFGIAFEDFDFLESKSTLRLRL